MLAVSVPSFPKDYAAGEARRQYQSAVLEGYPPEAFAPDVLLANYQMEVCAEYQGYHGKQSRSPVTRLLAYVAPSTSNDNESCDREGSSRCDILAPGISTTFEGRRHERAVSQCVPFSLETFVEPGVFHGCEPVGWLWLRWCRKHVEA